MGGIIDIEELISLPIFYFEKVSHDGKKVAFFWNKTGRHELYIKDIETGEIKQVSRGQLPLSPKVPLIWSRDDRLLVTGIDKDGNEQHDIYGFDIKTGEFFEIFKSGGQNYPADFSPDNKKLVFLSTKDGQMNLYIIDLDKKEVKKLTDFEKPVINAIFSDDGEYIYIEANETDDLRNRDVYRLRDDGTELELFFKTRIGNSDDIVDIKGDFAGIMSDFEGFFQPGIMNLKTKEVKWFGDKKHDEYALQISPDKKLFLTLRTENAQLLPHLYEIETGREVRLNLPKGAYNARFAGSRKLLLTHSAPVFRSRMILYDLDKNFFEIFQDAEYGKIKRESLSDAECVKYKSFDGEEIESILYKPKNLKEGEKVPVVVWVHGGPAGVEILRFSLYAQCLTSTGFAVFMPNFRGSFGYGKEFMESIIMDWGGKEQKDIAWGVKFLKQFEWIDEKRIAVVGGSFGGYSVYWQMVKFPQLWRAGVAWVGITDLLKLYEESMPHFKYFLKYYMGDPQKNKDLWIERSPITHIRNFKGPLLIIHGVNDPRCPLSQAKVFRKKLIELGFKEGKDFEYHELFEEGHGSTHKEHLLREFKLMVDFLKRKV